MADLSEVGGRSSTRVLIYVRIAKNARVFGPFLGQYYSPYIIIIDVILFTPLHIKDMHTLKYNSNNMMQTKKIDNILLILNS